MTHSRSLSVKVAALAVMASGLGACVAPVADPVAYSGYPATYDYYGYPAYYTYPAYYGYPAYYYRPPVYYAPPVFYGSVFFRSGGGRGHRW